MSTSIWHDPSLLEELAFKVLSAEAQGQSGSVRIPAKVPQPTFDFTAPTCLLHMDMLMTRRGAGVGLAVPPAKLHVQTYNQPQQQQQPKVPDVIPKVPFEAPAPVIVPTNANMNATNVGGGAQKRPHTPDNNAKRLKPNPTAPANNNNTNTSSNNAIVSNKENIAPPASSSIPMPHAVRTLFPDDPTLSPVTIPVITAATVQQRPKGKPVWSDACPKNELLIGSYREKNEITRKRLANQGSVDPDLVFGTSNFEVPLKAMFSRFKEAAVYIGVDNRGLSGDWAHDHYDEDEEAQYKAKFTAMKAPLRANAWGKI
eukprot:PhF_6_TR22356/c0_g2_i1/m.31669